MDKPDYKLLHPKRAAFLAAYSATGNISRAAEIAGIHRNTHHRWLKDDNDDEYAERFNEAKEAACDALEAEARRRAVEGWEEPIFHNGKVVGHRRRYSDVLLIFLLKGNNPAKFSDRHQHRHDGTINTIGERCRLVLDSDWYGTADIIEERTAERDAQQASRGNGAAAN